MPNCAGASPNSISISGASTPDAEEAAVKRAIVSAARRIVLLTDSTKFGVEYLRSFASLADIDVLVTDGDISPGDRQRCISAGIEVVIA